MTYSGYDVAEPDVRVEDDGFIITDEFDNETLSLMKELGI